MAIRSALTRLLSIIAVLATSKLVHAEILNFRCKALDPVTRKVLFSCSGRQTRRKGRAISAELTYRLPQGKVLAREKINFQKNAKSPDLILIDERDGRREMIERTHTGFNVLVQDSAKATPDFFRLEHSETDIAALTTPGLPEYIIENWKKLNRGEKLIFYCVFPAHKKLLRLRAQLVRQVIFEKSEAIILKMQPDNFVYRWFSEPVYLTVRLRDKRLVRYQGLHYIRDPRTSAGSIVDLTFSW